MIYLWNDIELPQKMSIFFAMTHIIGIGKFQAFFICKKLGLSKNLQVKDLSEDQLQELALNIETSNLPLMGELRKIKLLKFKELAFIKSYKGLRLKKGLPIRGQRTHTNAQTSRKRK